MIHNLCGPKHVPSIGLSNTTMWWIDSLSKPLKALAVASCHALHNQGHSRDKYDLHNSMTILGSRAPSQIGGLHMVMSFIYCRTSNFKFGSLLDLGSTLAQLCFKFSSNMVNSSKHAWTYGS